MSDTSDFPIPYIERASLDWLDSPQPYFALHGPDRVYIGCLEDRFDLEITAPPPVSLLTIGVQYGLILSSAQGIGPLLGLTVRLIVDDSRVSVSSIHAEQLTIQCSTAESARSRRPHRLLVPEFVAVEILDGEWHVEGHDKTDRTRIILALINRTRSLRVTCDACASCLEITGVHAVDLRGWQDSVIDIHEDSAVTCWHTLDYAYVMGAGTIRVLGDVTKSVLRTTGDVEVHGDIEDTEIDIGGDLVALGAVRLGDKPIRCQNATVRDELVTAGDVAIRGELQIT